MISFILGQKILKYTVEKQDKFHSINQLQIVVESEKTTEIWKRALVSYREARQTDGQSGKTRKSGKNG